MASGHMNRVKRPDTWLHRPMLQNVKKALANPEPSTHDPQRTSGPILRLRPLLLHFSFKDLTKPALWTAAMSRVSSASSWRDRRYRFEAVAAQGGLTFLRHHVSNEA